MFMNDSKLPSVKVDLVTVKDGEDFLFSKYCSITHELYRVQISIERYNAWKNDNLYIQEVLYGLTADQREFLMSGLTPAEFDALFGEE